MTDNELIAEFMGWKQSEGLDGVYHRGQWYNDKFEHLPIGSELQYHTSWEWLMPVVEKIGNLNMQYEFGLATHYSAPNPFGPIEGFYQYVVEFIKWYNQIEKEK